VHVVPGSTWRPTQVGAFTDTREGTVTSLREPTSLAHDCVKLIGQQRAERATLIGGNGSGGLEQFHIEPERDFRLHGTPHQQSDSNGQILSAR
jgi:hypothetical protein